MARARNIKPKFFQNDELGELPPLARLLFIGMWTIADFRGCLEFRPKRIKTQVLPYDECDIEALSMALDKSGFISIYSVQGQRYAKIIKFERHQTPHKNERDAGSDIPDVEEKDSEISELKKDEINPDKNGTTPAESLFPLPESPILNSEPGIPPIAASAQVQVVRQKPREAGEDVGFIAAWNAYPKRPGASRAEAYKAWSARIKEKVAPDDIIAGVRRYAAHIDASGTEPQFIKQPATFFGPNKHYESDWGPVQRTGVFPTLGKAGQATAAAAQRILERDRDASE